MIALIPGDTLAITAPVALGVFPLPVEWYVSWDDITIVNLNNNYNNYTGGGLAMVMVPPSPSDVYVIREISALNTNSDPVGIAITISGRFPTVTLFHAILGSHCLLKYNACPGQVMGWQIFDANGSLISANS